MVSGKDRMRLDGQMLAFLLRNDLPFAKVICKAAAEDPEQRYLNAEEMLHDLEFLTTKLAAKSSAKDSLYNLPRLRSLRTNGALPPLA